MAKILTQIEAHNIGNIRLFAGDAAELLAWAPPHSLARIDLIHPDPWPKRRHWKRRFVQDTTIAAMARALKPDGEFRFVSDIDDYCAWTLAHLLRSPDFVWTAEQASDWRLPWSDYTMTRYGRKAEREGRHAAYLRFRKWAALFDAFSSREPVSIFAGNALVADGSAGKAPLPSTVARRLAFADKHVAANGIVQALDAGLERENDRADHRADENL